MRRIANPPIRKEKDNSLNYRNTYAKDYSDIINRNNKDVSSNGINGSELESLLNLEFNYEKITYSNEFDKALDAGCPILSVIDGNVIDYLEDPIDHMIVIIREFGIRKLLKKLCE